MLCKVRCGELTELARCLYSMRLSRALLGRMDAIADIRHRNLLVLLDEAGSAKKLSDRTGVPAAYISQLRHRAKTPAGKPRGIGDDVARQLESGMGKFPGWMDSGDLSPSERELLDAFRALSEGGQEYTLAWLTKLRQLDRSAQ